MSAFGGRKSAYHSDLRGATEHTPLNLRFTTGVLDSKRRPDSTYIAFEVEDAAAGRTYTYEPETRAIEDQLRAWTDDHPGAWTYLTAHGRGEDATLTLELAGQEGAEPAPARRPPRAGEPPDPEPPAGPEPLPSQSAGGHRGPQNPKPPTPEQIPQQPPRRTEPAAQRVRRAIEADYRHALDAARQIVEDFHAAHQRPPTDRETGIAAALYIQYEREGGRRPIRQRREEAS